ncbi:2,3-diaminopropionate biosynthesis protein SbnA [Hamadaea tsunoensis]|uniref:2,3-diaminopropionate biosynthesis protein SbnA n=1 Tax=Hamadaea tsunoensis TaxID=53368 RepID=UPI00040AAF88|nr:2,3-diaminopropionate biosynthesis protein SbnA [Hamadaea tsunoensis]
MSSRDDTLRRRAEAVLSRHTPTEVVRLPHARLQLFAKLESANVTGSAKDRSAIWILGDAVRTGAIRAGTTVVESSSGNFALSLATYCHELRLDFVPVIDPNINDMTERTLRRMCRRVEKVTERDPTGGFLLSRLARVGELVREIEDAYWTDQYSNPAGARGHYELTGTEIVAQLERIDYLFVGVGTGATINGLSRRVKEANPDVVVVAVDVAGSAIFGAEPHRRLIPGIGSSIRPPLVEDAVISEIVTVSELEEVAGCRRLVRDHGVYAGGSTGAVYSAIECYFEGFSGPPPVVAFLCMDRGDPYSMTVYDDAWVAANFAPSLVTTTGQW